MDKDFVARCQATGLPWTRQREQVIVEVLSEVRDHPDVPELRPRVAARGFRISEGTITAWSNGSKMPACLKVMPFRIVAGAMKSGPPDTTTT